jgi:hypothetical protein
MKLGIVMIVACALGLGPLRVQAQQTNEVEQLKRELQQVREEFARSEREHRQQIEALSQKLDATLKQQSGGIRTSKPETPVVAPPAASTIAPVPVAKSWSPTDPIRIGKGGTYADLGMVATFAVGGSTASDIEGGTQLGGHDPHQRGFTVQGAELNLQGAVDPFFRGNANIAFLLDSAGGTGVELEEAWLETMSLPWNLQIRAGQILTDFGRINTQHPHSWAFVDAPIVSGRLLGEDGLRNPGARISWLVPTPFYSELFFGVQNSQGGTAFSFRDDHGGQGFLGRIHNAGRVKNLGDMLFNTRYAASFDLTDSQTLLAGMSAVFGPNGSGPGTDTQIYGVDFYWKWKSPRAHGGFPFVSWQTEALVRRYQAGAFSEDLDGNFTLDPGEPDLNGDGIIDSVPRETLTDWGLYSQVLWGFKPGWVAGLRGDYVTHTKLGAYEAVYGADPERATRWRISPNLTWYPSEFSKIRLQYNYDDRNGIGVDHSIWLQFEFLLGAHAAHKF